MEDDEVKRRDDEDKRRCEVEVVINVFWEVIVKFECDIKD